MQRDVRITEDDGIGIGKAPTSEARRPRDGPASWVTVSFARRHRSRARRQGARTSASSTLPWTPASLQRSSSSTTNNDEVAGVDDQVGRAEQLDTAGPGAAARLAACACQRGSRFHDKLVQSFRIQSARSSGDRASPPERKSQVQILPGALSESPANRRVFVARGASLEVVPVASDDTVVRHWCPINARSRSRSPFSALITCA